MNKKRIQKRLNKLIDEIDFFAFDLCALRNKTSFKAEIEALTDIIDCCAEASRALRNARDPNPRLPLYIPNLRGPAPGYQSVDGQPEK